MTAIRRVFLDTSVLVRYFADDDPPRSFAAAELVDSDIALCLSTAVLMETVHVLRTQIGLDNPGLSDLLVAFLTRSNVELEDADKGGAVAALQRARSMSPRRILDALIAEAAVQSGSDSIVAFDRSFPASIPVRLL